MPSVKRKTFYSATEAPIFAPVLLIPTVSAANVPQLAVDLLIHSLKLPLLGTLDAALLYPFVGPREVIGGSDDDKTSAQSGFCSALEVYGSGDLTVLHQRSPLLPHCTQAFLEQVIQPFMQLAGTFKQVCVLSSADATFRDDAQLTTPMLAFEGDASVTSRLRQLSLSGDTIETGADRPKLYGSGRFYKYMDTVQQCDGKTLGLCRFAYQGDNRADARALAKAALTLLQVQGRTQSKVAWREPSSWQTVFGPPRQVGELGGMIW